MAGSFAPRLARPLLTALALGLACGDAAGDGTSDEAGDGDSSESGTPPDAGDGDGDGDPGDGDGEPGDGDGDDWGWWAPGKTLPTPRAPNERGFLDRRGLIHAHSVHSHDACDDAPKDGEGNYDAKCDRDFREGLCRARHDFVFLTDHADTYASTEYPETLLHRPRFGDELVELDAAPIANWAGCLGFDAGNSGTAPFVPALIQAGCESATMPIGLPAHVGATESERKVVLGDASPAAITTLSEAGAVTLVAHTEDWSAQELVELPLDGFEMYNIHANLFLNFADVAQLLGKLGDPEALPDPELVLLPLISEDPAYVDTWSVVLATGARKLTTMGTDCHRNSFPELLPDGQRIDSYERLMKWFSNHLLVESTDPEQPEAFGPAQLHEALAAGRLFGVFELLGIPAGFDYHGQQNGEIIEIGGEPSLAEGSLSLRIVAPTLLLRDPATPAPDIQLRLLRATDGGWEQVDSVAGSEDAVKPLEVEIAEPGAYRAEVRIVPRHLAGWLGDYEDLADQDFVWIYANPIYVRD